MALEGPSQTTSRAGGTDLDKVKTINCKRVIVAVSTCYAGTVLKAVKCLPSAYRKKFIVFTSEDEEHKTITYGDFHPFFRAFNLGLSRNGKYCYADMNRNGEVTAKELYSYIYHRERNPRLITAIDSYDPHPSFYSEIGDTVIYK